MPIARAANELLSVNAFRGDAKTLLAFDLVADANRGRLAGFTVEIRPPGRRGYFADNNLRLAPSGGHAQVGSESPYATANAPVQRFRWVHAAGLVHQNCAPIFGQYTYVVTPRYFCERNSLLPLDPSAGVAVQVDVAPFACGALSLGFTRGYVYSQAFARRFGSDTTVRPPSDELLFDTGAVAGTDTHGDTHTYAEQNEWLGSTARRRVVDLLDEVRTNPALRLDVYTRELDEPDVCAALLALGGDGRVRILLDSEAQHEAGDPTPEERFAAVFAARAGTDAVRFAELRRHSHRTFVVVSDADGPRTVLTASAGLSITGLYVEANHVLTLEDRPVARVFADVFGGAWEGLTPAGRSGESDGTRTVSGEVGRDAAGVLFDFSPHRRTPERTGEDRVLTRVDLREVLQIVTRSAPVDAAALPAPFDRPVRDGRVLDHGFTVCGFRGTHPVVSCGIVAPTASGGRARGADVITIRDEGAATAFVIEALQLDDYHRFLARLSRTAEVSAAKLAAYPDKRVLATASGWFLDTTDGWADRYFDGSSSHHAERELFGR